MTLPTVPEEVPIKGEHIRLGAQGDFNGWLLIAALVAHEKATGTKIGPIPEHGLRVAMQINGVEVSVTHFIDRIHEHFEVRAKERRADVRKEAATLIKGRVSRVANTLDTIEKLLRLELADDFPELTEDIFEDR